MVGLSKLFYKHTNEPKKEEKQESILVRSARKRFSEEKQESILIKSSKKSTIEEKKDEDRENKYREALKVANLHPMLPTKYNALERKKLREFEQSLFPTEEDKRKYAEAVEGKQDESPRVIMSPVFSTPEQEKFFAEAAKKSMSTIAELEWEGKWTSIEPTTPTSEKTYKVLKNLRPNIEYSELLKDVALKIAVLDNPISPEMVEQIKELSKNTIEQGKKEKIEFENNKKEIFQTAMDVEVQRHEENKEQR